MRQTGASLLDRILDTPHLAHVVPRLQPELLHRVIQSCGLEDCGELVALATPEQLARIFDLDLWRTAQPGLDEQFDADRFGVWLEVLVESGATRSGAEARGDGRRSRDCRARATRASSSTARRSRPIRRRMEKKWPRFASIDDGLACDVGGYLLVARRTDSWDAIVAVLMSLDAEHHDYFHQVMRGCRTLSNSRPEVDGLHDLLADGDQVMFDLAVDRERRREKQGYVTPAQARAFLQMSRQLRLGSDAMPPANPLARAYFRAIDETTAADVHSAAKRVCRRDQTAPAAPEDSAEAVAAVVDVLLEAGILAQQPRALLSGSQGHAPRLGAHPGAHAVRARPRPCRLFERGTRSSPILRTRSWPDVPSRRGPLRRRRRRMRPSRSATLAWRTGRLTGSRRRHAAILRVEAGTALPDDFLVGHDLVSVFQVGWTVLHRRRQHVRGRATDRSPDPSAV